MRSVISIASLLLLAACGGSDEKVSNTEMREVPLAKSNNSPAFDSSFSELLKNYYQLKDALVASDEGLASAAAMGIAGKSDSIDLKNIVADSAILDMASGYFGSISAEAKALIALKGIEEKRKSFQIISENMYDLIRTVSYNKEKIYHQFCPMANNDLGAYWLSASSDIRNPYFGKKMLTCGEVKDSL